MLIRKTILTPDALIQKKVCPTFLIQRSAQQLAISHQPSNIQGDSRRNVEIVKLVCYLPFSNYVPTFLLVPMQVEKLKTKTAEFLCTTNSFSQFVSKKAKITISICLKNLKNNILLVISFQYLAYPKDCSFSEWGQFLQSFCRSTRSYVIARVAKLVIITRDLQGPFLHDHSVI